MCAHMKKVIKKRDSFLYLLKDGRWTGDTRNAWKIKTIGHACATVQDLRLKGVELLYMRNSCTSSVTAIIPLPDAA